MNCLINRDKTIRKIHELMEQSSCGATDQIDHITMRIWNKAILNAEAVIREQTKADTEKHAHWIVVGGNLLYVDCKCSACGYTDCFDDESGLYNYCPTCGAKMDEVVIEN